ncbi:chemotaxis protein MotA [Mariprofundus ferrinatatus]|jgi:chemotaxis protein MotA|uniref:Chemotaxis protein MotA n=1 Tax=Mariprofundus ferrinatatus TaxID=1921087 RepID=A0A2K8L6I1_9PROT|nr:MotA/TolQ/ExbB proton channel family protein [Mariprofundus ferrinatatus]ATX82928.1 chemotaxis protein MotA [Mariprofundus ferrinatatus]
MDFSTIAGILAGFGLIVLSIFLSAVEPGIYVNLTGLIIVIGGTMAATLVSYPTHELRKISKALANVFHRTEYSIRDDIYEIAQAARFRRHGNLAGIEERLAKIENPFLRTSIQLVVDNTPADEIVNMLQWRIKRLREKERAEAQVFHTMAAYAPAFGMFGTLVGMVNMLYGVNGPDSLNMGHNMAVALMTTLYGVLLANLIFKPVAIKLERRTEKRTMIMRMIVEGAIMLASDRGPIFIRETLKSFSAQYEDELRGSSHSSEDELRASTGKRSLRASPDDNF